MITLLLLACELDLSSPLPTASTKTSESADTADTADEAVVLGTCLADGGAFVAQDASAAWGSGIVALELGADGTLTALTEDGHLLAGSGEDLGEIRDLGAVGSAGAALDGTGDWLVADAGGARVGRGDDALADWSAVPYAWGDSSVSPDGSEVAFVMMACGVDYGVTDLETGERRDLDLGASGYPVSFEHTEDGRLVSALTGEETGRVRVLEDGAVTQELTLRGELPWTGHLEVLGDEALTATWLDATVGLLERADLAAGTVRAVEIPFAFPIALAMDARLSWALEGEGDLVATDGAALYTLGTLEGARTLAADPAGTRLWSAGADGVITAWGCE